MEVHFYQKVLLIFDFSDTLIQMLLENKKKKIRIFITNEACTFLSVENDNVKCLICIRELQKKKEKVQKLSSIVWGNFIATSKSQKNL